MTNLPFWWILARASGVAAYLLVTAGMVMGLVLRSGLAMTAVHGFALVMDDYVEIDPIDLIVPGQVVYRPLWVAAGVLSLWLMVIVSVTASMRRHMGAAVWKPLHFAGYGVFAAATVHGVMAGTDSGRPWMVAMYAGAVAVIVSMGARRFLAGPNAPLKRRRQPPPPTAQEVR